MTVLLPETPHTDVVRQGRAFGLDLDVGFRCPGLPSSGAPVPGEARARVQIRLAARRDLDPMPVGADRLWEARRPDGRTSMLLTAAPGVGYRFSAIGYGQFHIDAAATDVVCAPIRDAAWRWQRFLVGQVLPFLAVLHGYEVFHASAVRYAGRTAAFTGPSGGGKSSVATALVLRGAGLVTDDVMVLEPGVSDRPMTIHPGFGLSSVRHDAARRLGADAIRRLGHVIGTDDDGVRVRVDVEVDPPPLTHLFFLERRAAAAGATPLIQPIEAVDPRLLLAAGYNYVIRTPDRLERHLDVCARLARTASLHRITIPPDLGPADVAIAVEACLTGGGE